MQILQKTERDCYGQLDSGLEMHACREPGGEWRIERFSGSHLEKPAMISRVGLCGGLLQTLDVFPQQVGWENEQFSTPEEAFQFIEAELLAGRVKGLVYRPEAAETCW